MLVINVDKFLIIASVSTSQPSFQLAQSLPHLGNNDITATGSHIDEEQTGQLTNAARPIPIHLPQPQKPQKLPSYLPKDRPFANIVEVRHTTVAPQHLQRIMDTKGFKPADKSARLKAALRRDNQVLIAYCVLLLGKLDNCVFPTDFSATCPALTLLIHVQPWAR